MSINQETREIDGDKYFTAQIRPLASVVLGAQVIALLAPGLKNLKGMSFKDVKSKAKDVDFSQGLALISGLGEKLDGEKLGDLIEKCLVGNVHKNGKAISNIDMAFDSPVTMIKVLMFMLEINYKNFFSGLAS
jgi:hypothetical protein